MQHVLYLHLTLAQPFLELLGLSALLLDFFLQVENALLKAPLLLGAQLATSGTQFLELFTIRLKQALLLLQRVVSFLQTLSLCFGSLPSKVQCLLESFDRW